MSEYNKTLLKRYKDRLKETKKKKDKGEKPKKNEVSFAKQIKGLNDKIKELEAKNKKGSALGVRQDSRKNRIGGQTIEKRKKDKKEKETTDTGVGSLSGVSASRLKAKRETDKQSGDSRTNKPSQTQDIGGADIKSKVGEYTGEGRKRAGFRGLTEKEKPLADKLYNPRSKSGKATVSPNQKSRQASLPKDKDSFGAMLARAMGDKRSKAQMVRDREMNEKDEEEMGRNKGGAIKKTYGMRAGGFTKRGGMYKKGY